MARDGNKAHLVAFMDLGTNSVRLLVVRINPNQSYTIVTQQKETIRLGEGEFSHHRLQHAAMERGLLVCRSLVELARSYKADEIIAVATAATREADNQAEFVSRFREDTGLDLHVISGREEARLIYLGVSSGIHLGDREALFIDIGGGSTELTVGNQREFRYLDSVKLGAIRLTGLYVADRNAPVSARRYAAMQEHVRNTAVRTVQHLKDYRIDQVIGSSGTVESLANIAAKVIQKREPKRYETLIARERKEVIKLLCSLPLDERRKVPGLNPERADVIVAGAAILDTLLDELGVQEITVSDRGLRDGLLVDYLARTVYNDEVAGMSVRARSVLQLGRLCHFDETHAVQVSRLALHLFDSAGQAGLHTHGARERELLDYAARLHDIGMFLAYGNHHAHSYYFIRNADLLGFDQREIAIIATTVLFHRKTFPRPKHPEFAALDPEAQRIVRTLCVLLRLAESLDRSHAESIESARLHRAHDGHVTLEIIPTGTHHLELWSVQSHLEALKKAFGVTAHVVVKAALAAKE